MEKSKPKIGLLGLSLELYKKRLPDLMSNLKDFSQELKKVLGEMAEVVCYPLACSKGNVEEAFSQFKQEKVNGVILLFLSYSTSLSLVPVLKKYSFPMLIWNTQRIEEITSDFSEEDFLANHGMHGVQDLCSVLNRDRIPFSLITGHFSNEKVKKKVKSWCRAAQAAFTLKIINIGRIGGTFRGMGDFSVESKVLTTGLGPRVKEIPVTSLMERAREIREKDIRRTMQKDRSNFFIDESVEEETHFRSVKLELALRRIVKKEKLSALAMNFSALSPSVGVETIPLLGICKFLAEGLGYGGEGDIYSATAVYLLQFLAGRANFVEMFTTDYKNSCILMSHMGESNPQMAKKGHPVRMIQNSLVLTECLPTAVLSFTLEPGQVTLLNLKISSKRKLELILTKGEILDRPPLRRLSPPHFIFKPEIKVEKFLNQYSLYGGTHHCALCYGDVLREIRYLSTITEIPLLEI